MYCEKTFSLLVSMSYNKLHNKRISKSKKETNQHNRLASKQVKTFVFLCYHQLTVVPDSSLTFNAFCICEWTDTSMCAEAFPTMANPGFTEITNSPLQNKTEFLFTVDLG